MNIYNTQGSFTGNSALKTTQVLDMVGNKTGFYVVRYAPSSHPEAQTSQQVVDKPMHLAMMSSHIQSTSRPAWAR